MVKLKNKKSLSQLEPDIDPGNAFTRYLQEALTDHPAKRYLTGLSTNTKLAIYLIGEDLRCHYFFSAMREIGFDDTFYQPELSSVILACIDFTTESTKREDPAGFYFDLLNRHRKRVKDGNRFIARSAVDIYVKLMMERKGRSRNTNSGRSLSAKK